MATSDRSSAESSEQQLRQACAVLDRGLRAGTTRAEDLLAEHPTLASSPDLAIELIFSEFVTREALGQQPTPEDFYTRFPQWRDRLERLFQVDALLKDDSATSVGSGHDRPAGSAGPAPKQIGPYELLEEIGRGGMGVVYKAYHPTLHRVVALKLLRYGVDATERERERFRREAEVVARLQHPNIVQVFEVGEHEGQPFLALEHVAGCTLRTRLDGKPLPPADAAALIETLANAVQHAHEHEVVHRDLKPANILLAGNRELGIGSGESGTVRGDNSGSPLPTDAQMPNPNYPPPIPYSLLPKITDFGLAVLLVNGQARSTSGQIVGTVSYMAPEQALGKTGWVAPAVDIYALGAILYECLTGRPPFLADSDAETLRQLVADEPTPPRRLQPRVPRDLETICLKCLAKEPSRRYARAADLADDLRRFREHLPILARPIGPLARMTKWARRRPAAAALVFVSMLGTVTLISVVTAYTTQLRAALADARWHQQKAEDSERQAQTALSNAANQRDQTRQALDALAGLTDVAFADQPRLIKQHEKTVADVLSRYEQLADAAGDDPAARFGAAQAQLRSGRLQKLLGRLDDAERSLTTACTTLEALSKQSPAQVVHQQSWADALEARANLRAGRGQIAAAATDFRAALDLAELLRVAEPTDLRHRTRWAGLVVQNGTQLVRLRQPIDFSVNLDSATAIWDERLKDNPNDPEARIGRAGCDRLRGFVAQRQNRLAEAETHFRDAIDQLGPGDSHAELRAFRASYQMELAGVFINLRRGVDAEPLIRAALIEYERRAANAPDVPEYRSNVAFAQSVLAMAVHLHKNFAEAEKLYIQALPVLIAAFIARPDQPEAAMTAGGCKTNYGQLFQQTARHPEALDQFDSAIAMLEPVVKRNDAPPAANQFLNLALKCRAEVLTALNRHGESADAWAKVLSREAEPQPEWRAWHSHALARAGRSEEALTALNPLTSVVVPWATAFEVARACSLAAAASQDPAVVERAGKKAVATLNAINAGGGLQMPYRQEQLRTHPDWNAIRGRADFEKLMNGGHESK